MKNPRRLGRLLLWIHLFVCLVWLYVIKFDQAPGWMGHVLLWSILGVQFTWGFTVGMMVGPSRRNRGALWWSLLTIFMPLYFLSFLIRVLFHHLPLPVALMYFGLIVMILASETFAGVLLGVKTHAQSFDD